MHGDRGKYVYKRTQAHSCTHIYNQIQMFVQKNIVNIKINMLKMIATAWINATQHASKKVSTTTENTQSCQLWNAAANAKGLPLEIKWASVLKCLHLDEQSFARYLHKSYSNILKHFEVNEYPVGNALFLTDFVFRKS